MALKIELKRSSVPGKVPTTTELALGELAINTYDGKLFLKKNVSGTETIIDISGGGTGSISGSINTGSFVTTSSFNAYTSSINTYTSSLNLVTSSFVKNSQTSSMTVLSSSYALTASFALNAGEGSITNQIATGSITASVDVNTNNLFLIKSGSNIYFNISSSSNTTLSSNLLIVKNFTTQQPVLTISQSIVQFATQSSIPTGVPEAGSIWFTSSSFYVGLDT
jgi:hypothetical protein